MTYRTYTQWFLLGLALIAWAAVGLFAWTITSDEADRLMHTENANTASTKRASAVRTHALALDTEKQGAELGNLLNVDVVSAAYTIEAVGKSAGVSVQLGDAVPENVPTTSDTVPIKAVGFTVEAQGKFSALMRAAKLFETLPLPSTLVRLDLEHTPSSQGSKPTDQWHLNAYIRVLTTSDISS